MRYNNLKKVVSLQLEEDKPFVYYMSLTGGKYYVILLHNGNLVAERFANEDIAKKYILGRIKTILDSFVGLSQILLSHKDLLYEIKKVEVLRFSYN